MEFEWKRYPGFSTFQILADIQTMSVNLSNSKDESSSCQCTTTLYGEKNGNKELCTANSVNVAEYARRFAPGHRSFLGPRSETKWYGTHTCKPNGEWDNVAEIMMINFCESGHPVFRGSSALELKSKGKGKSSVHFNGSDETVEVVLRLAQAILAQAISSKKM